MLVLKQQLKEARIPQAVVARAVAVSEATLAACLEEAEKLLAHTACWLRDMHPELGERA